jgi:uncharacterized membrane protein (UPF0127 family)
MLRSLPALLVTAIVLLTCCACGDSPTTLDEYQTTPVTLPGGQQIRAEMVSNPKDMLKGLQYRDSLAPNRGMIFLHGSPGFYPYWMYQVRIPLDIFWLDTNRKVVEISADTPPCKTAAKQCATYGGTHQAVTVFEMPAGSARKYGIKVGDTIKF